MLLPFNGGKISKENAVFPPLPVIWSMTLISYLLAENLFKFSAKLLKHPVFHPQKPINHKFCRYNCDSEPRLKIKSSMERCGMKPNLSALT